jgi:hypothetical protein
MVVRFDFLKPLPMHHEKWEIYPTNPPLPEQQATGKFLLTLDWSEPNALASGLVLCAEHVDLLGGASPLFNLMEVKNE